MEQNELKSELKKLGIAANGDTWNYLQKPSLGEDEKVQMLCCAYSSLYLWAAAGGTPLHFARGHWLISRVCCVLGEAKLAKKHAQLCHAYTEQATDRKDFDDVYALEAEARALALNGELELAKTLKTKAQKLASEVKDAEDKQIVEGDLKSAPWFGLA